MTEQSHFLVFPLYTITYKDKIHKKNTNFHCKKHQNVLFIK